MPRILIEAAALSPGSELSPLLDHPRAGRILRNAMTDALVAAGIECSDCRVVTGSPREVSFAEILPYVAAAIYVGADDMAAPLEKPAFHACVGGLRSARVPDDELGAVALASLLAVLDDPGALGRVRAHVADARRVSPSADPRAVTDLLRSAVSTDAELRSSLRRRVAEEARVAGMRCVDCRDADPEGTWSLRWRRSRWWPAHVDGALTIRSDESGWSGAGWAETMFGNRFFFDLEPVEVTPDGVRFTAKRQDALFHFEAVVSGSTMDGSVAWTNPGGAPERDAFVAVRRDLRRFEDDAVSSRFPRLSLGGPAGDELDRLILLAEEGRSDALLVLIGGRLACHRRFGSADEPLDLQSITKAVSSLAVPLLIEDGAIESIDEPLSTWLPELAEGGRGGITLRHLLTHSSGLDPGSTSELNQASDRTAHALTAPLLAPPGTKYEYNNRAFQLLSGVVRKAAGSELDTYLARRLFEPLGLTSARWARDGAGHAGAYAGLSLSAEDLAVIGRVLADGGRWNGKQVLATEWVASIPRPAPPGEHSGLGWFRLGASATDGFAHSGSGGQVLAVIPDADMVVVRLARIPPREDESAEMDVETLASHLAATVRGP